MFKTCILTAFKTQSRTGEVYGAVHSDDSNRSIWILRQKIYNILVNRRPGIGERYHKFHDGSAGIRKILSWFYLFWLNFCYYILFCRFLGQKKENVLYEEKKPPVNQSESELACKMLQSAEQIAAELMRYDVVSFDIFDTLIFRPFSEPADLFFFVGEKLGFMDFKRLRMNAEAQARKECRKKRNHSEVTLKEIWEKLAFETGICAEEGMRIEQETELSFCFANPFMREVFDRLLSNKKRIVITSDMYLPEKFLSQLLTKNGYEGFGQIFISCEYGKNKAEGTLYDVVKQEVSKEGQLSVVHVGDNPQSDIKNAKKHGISTYYYPNVNRNSLLYRPYDMSAVIGGAYRGIVNTKIYSGMQIFSMEYEYGYIYGGLFVLGYCNFIHTYAQANGIEKLLFLSRDGDILRQAYAMLFPEEKTEYAYWSRAAATKLMARYNRYDYFRRYLYHKVNSKITLENIFCSMEQDALLETLPDSLNKTEFLTSQNVEIVKLFLEEHWDEVLAVYDQQSKAGAFYYKELIGTCKKAAAVDIGWAGSGAVSLNYLAKNEWNLPCKIIGIIAGSNTVHNAEPDAGEMFLQKGELVSYLYSQSLNRDLWKKHNPNLDYNIFWELLLSSPTKQFKGFSFDEKTGQVSFQFGKTDANLEGIKEIQRGILDFIKDYMHYFEKEPYMGNISGRDAYAPILCASGNKEAYLKAVEKKFQFEVNVI